MLVMAGPAAALPIDVNSGAIVQARWTTAQVRQDETGAVAFFRDDASHQNTEPLWLLSAIDEPSLIEAAHASQEEGIDKPVSTLALAAMQGTWLDPALMRLVQPIDLVRHYKHKHPRRRY